MRYLELLNKYTTIAKYRGLEEEAVKLIVAEISDMTQTEVYLHYNDEVSPLLVDKIISSLEKYITGYPAQYILGYTYFYGLKLKVCEDVLIPRFDTEVVVEQALKVASFYKEPKVLDICTGSGAIAIALAKNGISSVDALDISKNALKIARINARDNGVKIRFFESDLLRNVKEKYDILISNPPYIENNAKDVDKMVLDHEPHLALFGGDDGLDFYRAILKDAKDYLNPGGSIIFEIPYDKANEIRSIALMYFKNIQIEKDLANNDRVMIIS